VKKKKEDKEDKGEVVHNSFRIAILPSKERDCHRELGVNGQ
jgi:hypothetical protein